MGMLLAMARIPYRVETMPKGADGYNWGGLQKNNSPPCTFDGILGGS